MNGSDTKKIQSIKFSFTIIINIPVRISSFTFQTPTHFLFNLTNNKKKKMNDDNANTLIVICRMCNRWGVNFNPNFLCFDKIEPNCII